MSVFGKYSRYYDLLYRDKDYRSEVEFVCTLLDRHVQGTRKILELGCGTGMHAVLLAQKGYVVHGVDMSGEMLELAAVRLAGLPQDVAQRLNFSVGDVKRCQVEGLFDVVISLFHVVSYQTTNDDLAAMFKNAAAHLRPGGLFIFDFWYGPAVLTDRPAVRIKRMESDEVAVTRLADPVMHAVSSLVDVNYHVFIRDKVTGVTEELRETHSMRYLFSTEIDLLARVSGLRVLNSCEWMTGHKPGYGTWGVCSVLVK